jgi:hypothetical protein
MTGAADWRKEYDVWRVNRSEKGLMISGLKMKFEEGEFSDERR